MLIELPHLLLQAEPDERHSVFLIWRFQFHEQTRPQNDLSVNSREFYHVSLAFMLCRCRLVLCKGWLQLSCRWIVVGSGGTRLSSCLRLRDLIGSALISAGAPLASQPLVWCVFSAPNTQIPLRFSDWSVGKRRGGVLLRGGHPSLSPSASILLPVSRPPKRFRAIRRVVVVVGLFGALGPQSCSEKQAIRCLPCSQVEQRENLFEAELLAGQMEHCGPVAEHRKFHSGLLNCAALPLVWKQHRVLSTPQDSAHGFSAIRTHMMATFIKKHLIDQLYLKKKNNFM